MADKKDLDYTYTEIDEIFRLSLGENADFSGARYNGDFSLTLEQAQRAKHDFIADQLGIKEGSRVLDMGCGWGPFLAYLRDVRKAKGIGLTLSQGQYEACRKNGHEVYIKDCRTVRPEDFGLFDHVVTIGGLEHFCTVEDYKAGKQKQIYQDFFRNVYNLMPPGARYYIQSMTYGRNMLPYEQIDIHAKKNSDAHILGLMEKYFPGSWLPYGSEMILETASPYFNMVNISSGRLDYIETTNQWRKRVWRFQPRKYAIFLSLLPRYFTSADLRNKAEVLLVAANKKCFERELFDHFRIVFEKK